MRIDLYEDIVSAYGFREETEALRDGEALELHIDSCGGDVLAGIAIANRIRELAASGHKATCTVDGLAASIASVIAMACNEIRMYPQSFLMIHSPWVMTMGNAGELRKEADTLDTMKEAIVSFYRGKFDRTDDEIRAMMDAETWISGENAGDFGLTVTLIEADSYRAAAKVSMDDLKSRFNAFAKVRSIKMENDIEKKEEEKREAEEVEKVKAEEVEEEEKTEKTESEESKEEPKEEPKEDTEEVKALKARIAELEEEVKRLKEEQEKPIEERLAKCQSVFQNKINDLKKEQQERDGKLRDYENRVSNLEAELATSKGELTRVQAALAEKEDALVRLNASVLKPSSAKVYDKASARAELAKLPMNEREDFYSKHRETIG